MGSWRGNAEKSRGKGKETKGFDRPPQAWELYKAIDGHDIEYIMRVRDHAFVLLLTKASGGGEFPVVYAARQGEKHRDVVILLVGAMSRHVRLTRYEGGRADWVDMSIISTTRIMGRRRRGISSNFCVCHACL
jgi:hypothetical protein